MLRTAVPYPALKTNPVPQRAIFFAFCSEPAHSALSNDAAPACMAQDSAVTHGAGLSSHGDGGSAQSVLLHMCSHSVQ